MAKTPLQLMEEALGKLVAKCKPEDVKSVLPRGVKLHSCAFVPATKLVPRQWNNWFWALISDNAPFSWGDNNITLVDPDTFANHCEERLCEEMTRKGYPVKFRPFIARVRALGNIYIDLES